MTTVGGYAIPGMSAAFAEFEARSYVSAFVPGLPKLAGMAALMPVCVRLR